MRPLEKRISNLESGLAPEEPMPEGLDGQHQLLWAITKGGHSLESLVLESMEIEAENANA